MTKARYEQLALFLLRVVAGLLFMQHGGMTLFGWLGGMPGGAKVPVMSEQGIAGILELIGGVLIVAGLATRPVAFILSGLMAVAYWQVHAPHGMSPLTNHGEPAVLYCFIFLYFAARGAGEYSLDGFAAMHRRRNTRPGATSRPATQL